ncbi:MAG TPA: IPT/TIG domain-containing protein, partial [Terriglobales bacterium]|nr:IPT/TIG domain-containing protein [Terriglobales bacterium]
MNARRVRLLIVCLSAVLALASQLSAQSAGYLSGRMIMTPWNYPQPDFQPVNLSDPEILDWTYWGLSSNTSVDRKSGAGIIGSLSVVGPDVPTQDQNCFDEFTWNNGDQNPSVPIACAGLMVFNTGEGYQFTVPADRTPKTLKLYVGIEGATARLEAHLSDASASAYVDTSLVTDGAAAATYIIDFQAGSPGQTLTVTYTLDQLEWGEVTIEAAVLTPKHPSVAITQPTPGQAFTAPAMFTASASASQVGATLDSVSLLQDGNSLLTLTSPPFNFDVSGLVAGNYQLTAQALDSNNLTQTSDPVPIHVVGSGGELAATIAAPPNTVDLTQQGTADWILLGRDPNVDVDRKANVAPLIHTTAEPSIGGVSLIDWAYSYFYDDNLVTYTAEDGNNQVGPVTCGIFLPNPGSGFEFSIDAGTTERTVNIYLGAYRAQGELEAYLSDGSAVPFVDTSTDSGATNVKNQVYSLTYHAASEGQKLIVRYTLLNNYDYGNVTLQAITVNGAPRPFPAIASVSHTADMTGTLIWINGSNFGTNPGTVLFNGVPAQVVSWSDTAIEVAVPPGATSGPVIVNTDDASSNGVNFTVTNAGSPGPPATILPAKVSMLIGDIRKFQVADSAGRTTTASSWSSSDPTIADFSSDPDDPTGPPILTAKAAGQVTIAADTATTDVTVYDGITFPHGTVMWSAPSSANGNGSGFSVQAMPAPSSLADLFIVQPSGLVQALKADGTLV